MFSIADSSLNKISSTKDNHRITLIYRFEDGDYRDGYFEPAVDLMGGVGGKSIDEMINEAYESLERATKAIGAMPFDSNNFKNSVKFDLVECRDEHEMDIAHDLVFKRTSAELIDKALFEMREKTERAKDDSQNI